MESKEDKLKSKKEKHIEPYEKPSVTKYSKNRKITDVCGAVCTVGGTI